LESGLKLDLNSLARRGFVQLGGVTAGRGIRWTNSYWGEVASGTISSDMRSLQEGWFQVRFNDREQHMRLVARPRHFGGRQWYFVCPRTYRQATVLWMPPGANFFACRQFWGRRAAYVSQFLGRDDRAHRGQSKINLRLCQVGGLDPDEWDLAPKPKWMRWKTYNRAVDKFERYDAQLDEGIAEVAARLFNRVSSN
jgi:hypothetical protein